MTKFLQPSPLLTDLYQLTMLQGYLDHKMDQNADFEFFVRDLPEKRNFMVAAGLEQVLDYLEDLKFTPAELDWLSSQEYFNHDFIDYLEKLRFDGDVFAMQEGTIFFPNEPILRISAPIPLAQLVETRVINLLHFQTMIVSKAVRSVIAADDKLLVDFGLRRAHGAEAGLYAARASYMAGYTGTSTVLAGKMFNIPLYGTMAHSFIQAHDEESVAFENFALSQPNNVVLLVDTYDINSAIEKVIQLAKNWKKRGLIIKAVRLDSGDLVKNSRAIRQTLDRENLSEIKIFVSGNLDEYAIQRFSIENAPIDGFGVGTLMTTSADAAYLECGYKLVQYAGTPRFKQSQKKVTQPCRKQVFRFFNSDGIFSHDEITLDKETRVGEPLLTQVMKNGKRISAGNPLLESRDLLKSQVQKLPAELLNLNRKYQYTVNLSKELYRIAEVNNINK